MSKFSSTYTNSLRQSEFKLYPVQYNFHHHKMGFQNTVTIEALSEDHAIVAAQEEVKKAYGKGMFKKFTFTNQNYTEL